jgi:hypothetical protein
VARTLVGSSAIGISPLPSGYGQLSVSLGGKISVSSSVRSGQRNRQFPAPIDFSDIAPKVSTQKNVLGIRSFGVAFELSANHAELLQSALPHLPPGSEKSVSGLHRVRYSLACHRPSSANVGPWYRLNQNGRRIFTSTDRQEFLEHFGAVIALRVAERSATHTFVHAGVVGWGDRAIVIPGRSFAGKTSLVAELVGAGAAYYSDEFALVHKRGVVYPYARPLQIRENGSDRQTCLPVEALGGKVGRKPLRVGLVIVCSYKPRARWRPRRLSPGIGLLRMLDNTVSARRSPETVLSTLKQVVSDADIVEGVRGEATQVVNWVVARYGPPAPRFGAKQ